MRVFLLYLLLVTSIAGWGQAKPVRTLKINENSIVKDGSGQQLPTGVWQALMQSGRYRLVAEDPNNQQTAFKLVEMNDAEREKLMNTLPRPRESAAFVTGKKPRLFRTTDINGNKIDLRDAKGKIVVLNFWFINCPPCRREIPELNRLVAEFKGNDSVVFVAVALDEKAELQDFLRTMPFDYQVLYKGQYLAEQFNIKAFPTHAVFTPDGAVYFHTEGLAANTVHWIRKSILELLRPPAQNGALTNAGK